MMRIFTIFAKNSRNYKIFKIKPHKECSVHGNTCFTPSTTFLWRTVWSGHQQKGQKLKNRHRGWQLHLYGDTPHWTSNYQIWWEVSVSGRRRNHWWQILSRSVERFLVWGSENEVSHWLDSRRYKRSALQCCLWSVDLFNILTSANDIELGQNSRSIAQSCNFHPITYLNICSIAA